MATVGACEQALRLLAARLGAVDTGLRERHAVDRTLTCHILDLEAHFSGRIDNGALTGLTALADPNAQIRIALTSDDLVSLTHGTLNIGTAWATGRVRVDASVFDLLKLRALL